MSSSTAMSERAPDLQPEIPGGAVLVDVGSWQVIVVTGADRLSFLHRLLTNTVDQLLPGQGRRALLLTIKGHVVVELCVCARPDDVWLLVPPGQGEVATAALSRYAIMDDVALALRPELELLTMYGPAAAERLRSAGLAVPAEIGDSAAPPLTHAEVAFAADGADSRVTIVCSPGLGTTGLWLISERAILAALAAALHGQGVTDLSPELAEGLRIHAGEPRFGVEITPEVFPMEVGLDHVIDYGKGCYLGQEPIVRIRDRGHLNRRLVGLRLPADAVVAAGDGIETDERPKTGRVTSAARLGEGPVALAMVHVSAPVGATVRVRHGDQLFAAEVLALDRSAGGEAGSSLATGAKAP
jgi:folate-binding protein YgfZ